VRLPAPTADHADSRRRLLPLSLAALGIVYGDIGTSPIYTLRECFLGDPEHTVAVNSANVLGVLSLIFWSLLIVISVKYLVFILRADNRGEGGILALMALVSPSHDPTSSVRKGVILLGLFGAALLYANGMLTPAITVLSAVEGLTVTMPFVERWVIPITLVIVSALFLVQAHGTARVGAVFGPVILLWFVTIGILGLVNIFDHPDVLAAISPHFALKFFALNGMRAFVIMGTVFLVVTGGEALYADLGHFGARPIRCAWFVVVLPSLVLNYFGQGALLLHKPDVEHPFFESAPSWSVVPLVFLAAAAAAIASQAIITGAFSLTRQAIQLGYSPRMRVEHTSAEQIGQIYLPVINWSLMIACLMLVLGFRTSSNLAAAYGVAITMTMVITTLLFFVFLREVWNWSLPKALALCGAFLLLDLAYFAANVPKIADGGWIPLAVAAAVYIAMSTWRRGRQLLGQRMRQRQIPLELFLADLLSDPPPRVPGLAVFMSGNPIGTPPALRHNLVHNHILHETVVIVTVQTLDAPYVPPSMRTELEEIGKGFWRVALTYGFMDDPLVHRTLRRIEHPSLDFCRDDISYFLGRETLLATARPGMARWRERLFVWMSRNAQAATDYFHLPAARVMEIGTHVEL
jgi:KUP system potassium uptake protein